MPKQSSSYSLFKSVSVFLGIIISISFIRNPECNLLPDGKYKLQYHCGSNEKESIVEIQKGRFKKCCVLGDTLSGTLTWIYGCYVLLKTDNEQPDTTSAIQKMIYQSFGPTCMELETSNGDSIFFRTTYLNNVHITVSKGRFIRLRR